MKYIVNKSKCTGCGACLRSCPYGAIKIGEDGKAFIDQNKCKKCGTCQKICPFGAIEEISEEADEKNVKQLKNPLPPRPTPISYEYSTLQRQKLGIRRGMGRGMGRGPGRGSQDGRGRGRGGGNRGR